MLKAKELGHRCRYCDLPIVGQIIYELGFMPLLGIDDYEHIPESEDSPFIVPFSLR